MLENLNFSWQLIVACAVAALIGYLSGSVNFAIITTRIRRHKDIRDYGSGNAGMTNVLRTFGKRQASLVFVGDFLKGLGATLLGYLVVFLIASPNNITIGGYVACFFALVGHLFPLYHGFRGGKGILVSAGAILAINPIAFAIVIAVFAIVVLSSRIVSLASITAAVAFPLATMILALVQNQPSVWFQTIFAAIVAVMIIIMHRQNIGRLIRGEEHRFGSKKKQEKTDKS